VRGVGTSSLRRQAQLKAVRPDLDIHPLRGNVDTRLRKLEQGEYDAIILASAGSEAPRQNGTDQANHPAEIMCPAAGQGALGIEIREGDAATRRHLEFLNDPAARAATTCERALLNSLGGGCQVPIGAFAEIINGKLHLESIVADPTARKFCAIPATETLTIPKTRQRRRRRAAGPRRRPDPRSRLRSRPRRPTATVTGKGRRVWCLASRFVSGYAFRRAVPRSIAKLPLGVFHGNFREMSRSILLRLLGGTKVFPRLPPLDQPLAAVLGAGIRIRNTSRPT
jgi:hypothetical protein